MSEENPSVLHPIQDVCMRSLLALTFISIPEALPRYADVDLSLLKHHELQEFAARVVSDDNLWQGMPSIISVPEEHFSELLSELEKVGCEIKGVSVRYTSYTKEALREELERLTNRFEETVQVLSSQAELLEDPPGGAGLGFLSPGTLW
ncbi:MAG: hypothetical protein OQJ98_03225 [Candidatus Pacebacteria bacterium]|nr:hypothetical protein [Candidatus Paceibacterota bacterium]